MRLRPPGAERPLYLAAKNTVDGVPFLVHTDCDGGRSSLRSRNSTRSSIGRNEAQSRYGISSVPCRGKIGASSVVTSRPWSLVGLLVGQHVRRSG
jgi:hypothetical protein